MSPTSRRFAKAPRILALIVLLSANLGCALVAHAQNAGGHKNADKPFYAEYKGVRIGMNAAEARKKLGDPSDKGDAEDFFVFSDKESARVFYDKGRKVVAVSVNYLGANSGAPLPQTVLGTDIAAKPDGASYKLVRYPEAGYWVSYNRTGGDDPLITVTMQKIQ